MSGVSSTVYLIGSFFVSRVLLSKNVLTFMIICWVVRVVYNLLGQDLMFVFIGKFCRSARDRSFIGFFFRKSKSLHISDPTEGLN